MREGARADIAALREESRQSLERETRLLRDMRDRSELEAERLAAEVKDCRRDLDAAAARYRALQHKSDASTTSLAAELKIKTVDADRAHVSYPFVALLSHLRDTEIIRDTKIILSQRSCLSSEHASCYYADFDIVNSLGRCVGSVSLSGLLHSLQHARVIQCGSKHETNNTHAPYTKSFVLIQPVINGLGLQMTLAERDLQLQRAEAQNDLLSEKVKVLTNSLFAKESRTKWRSEIPAQPIGWTSGDGGDGSLPHCSGDTDFSATDGHSEFENPAEDPRMQQSVLSAQCKALECELQNLRAERDSLMRKLERATRGAALLPPMLAVT